MSDGEIAIVYINGKRYELPIIDGQVYNNTEFTIPAGTVVYWQFNEQGDDDE